MNRLNNTKSLVESSILTGMAIVLILLCLYLPAFNLIGFFICPIPYTLIYIRHGGKYCGLSLLSSLIISAIISDPITSLGLILIFGSLGAVLGYSARSKKSPEFTIAVMSITALLTTIIVFKIYSVFLGHDVINTMTDQLQKTMQGSYKTIRNTYISSGMDKASVDKMISMLPNIGFIKVMLPSTFLMYSVFVSFICYIVTQKILRRIKCYINELKPISEWYIKTQVAAGVICIFVLSALMLMAGMKNGSNYLYNAYALLSVVFIINAVALLSNIMKRKKVPRFLRWIIIFILVLPPFGQFLFFVGLFDYTIDYRKLDKNRKRPVK